MPNIYIFRGTGSDKVEAFRENYSRCAELWSLVPSSTPIAALTATATEETKKFIIDNLSMREVKVFSQLPDKSNIYYEIIKGELNKFFTFLFSSILSCIKSYNNEISQLVSNF